MSYKFKIGDRVRLNEDGRRVRDEKGWPIQDITKVTGLGDAYGYIYVYGDTELYSGRWFELVEEATHDYINADHYKGRSKEVIDMMVDIWGAEAVALHCEMCAFKYRMRIGYKPDQPNEREIGKALWYEAKAKELRSGQK